MRWDFWLLFQHVVSDFLIAIAYFSIPAALVVFVRLRKDVDFGILFWLFSAFIFSCGMTHLFEIYVLWRPEYWIAGWMKAITAAVSVATAIVLWRIIPQALKIPSVNQLEAANENLRSELKRRQEAELSNQQKDEFLATLSHELRTPLNAIMGWTHLLSMESPSAEQVKEGTEVIARNARMQAQLINDLLDLSGIAVGKIKIDPLQVNLKHVVESAMAVVKLDARQRNITLSLDMPEEPVLVAGDAKRLQQIVWNLLNNAVKFTPTGGSVGAVVRREQREAVVSIVDSGIGIDPDFLPLIFERFRQADSSTTRVRGGLGIGLSLARELVLLHGGTIEAKSDGRDKGSTFTIRIPLDPSTHQPSAASVSEEPSHLLQGRRILIIDDHEDSRQVAAEVCAFAGAIVQTADSARDAWKILEEKVPDVILCDLAMPGEDGFEFARECRKRDDLKNVIFVAVSAMTRDTDRLAASTAGYHAHVAKPLEPSELLATIQSLIRSKLID